ncbi:hypothetical protein NC652_001573 [Populus alba x Populus x berolinensis]|nr:hypothetical protein NC652_001573 [Populus alba x Populus x berolinensis]
MPLFILFMSILPFVYPLRETVCFHHH